MSGYAAQEDLVFNFSQTFETDRSAVQRAIYGGAKIYHDYKPRKCKLCSTRIPLQDVHCKCLISRLVFAA